MSIQMCVCHFIYSFFFLSGSSYLFFLLHARTLSLPELKNLPSSIMGKTQVMFDSNERCSLDPDLQLHFWQQVAETKWLPL